MDQEDSEHQLSLTLLENGLDFILKGLDELFGENHVLKDAKAIEIETRNYKYGIMNLFAGFLLLLKERLSRHIPELIFNGSLAEVRKKLENKTILNTVDLDLALERLEIGPKVNFDPNEMKVIRNIQSFRNRFEHYQVKENKYQLWAEVTKFVDIIEKFLHDELKIELEKYSPASAQFHKKANILRENVEKSDGRIAEKEVFEVLRVLSNKEISGRLLGSDGNIILPAIIHTQKPYAIGTRKYIPDFEGYSKDGLQWVIEVKGAYMNMSNSALEWLLTIQNQSPQTRTWLIVLGTISLAAKDFALKNKIYFTDVTTWQEIKGQITADQKINITPTT